jgi:hypothetical protein
VDVLADAVAALETVLPAPLLHRVRADCARMLTLPVATTARDAALAVADEWMAGPAEMADAVRAVLARLQAQLGDTALAALAVRGRRPAPCCLTTVRTLGF